MTSASRSKGEDVAAVAAKLTAGQRTALLRAELDGNLDRYFARFISVPVGRGLVRAQLGTAVWSGVVLSELGVTVRAHLTDQEGQNR